MIERNYTYTISHCSKAIEFGLNWLLGELEKYDLQKGCILTNGKGQFCDKFNVVYREGLGDSIVKKLCDNGFTTINGRIIELQYSRNISLSSVGSVLAIHPSKGLVNKIEEDIAHNYRLDRPYLPPLKNSNPKSLMVIPWAEFEVEEWIAKYIPNKVKMSCAEDYKYGNSILKQQQREGA